MTLLLIPVIAFGLSTIAVGLLRRGFLGRLMDVPNARSSHTQPTPRGGGLGFIIGFAGAGAIALWLTPSLLMGIPLGVWGALVPLIVVGLWDDWQGLPATTRYGVQLGCAIAIVLLCGAFPLLGQGVPGTVALGCSLAMSILGVTALINFYNFMDGLDGLVASVTAVQLSFLALWIGAPVLGLWVAALAGFLLWNWTPAKIFMGDVGSTTLGAVVAAALLVQAQEHPHPWVAIAILCPLMVDAVYTLLRRWLRGENIFQAHRTHLYQRLHQAGWGHGAIAGLYLVLTGMSAIAVFQWGEKAAIAALAANGILMIVGEQYLKQTLKPTDMPLAEVE